MNFKIISETVNRTKQRGYQEGLGKKDYIMLKEILKSMNGFNNKNIIYQKVYDDAKDMCDQIYKGGVLNKFSSENADYILKNSSVLPFVFANNDSSKVKISGIRGYAFPCQFHPSKDKCMIVYTSYNSVHCMWCSYNANVVKYLQDVEGINCVSAIELIAQTYMYKIGKKNYDLIDKVRVYHNTIVSPEYKALLELRYKTLKERGISLLDDIPLEEYFEKQYDTIERIRLNEYDPNFHYVAPPKMIKLKK